MSSRKIPLVNGEFYHVYNRGINKQAIFVDDRDFQRIILTVRYYRVRKQVIKLSYLLAKSNPEIEETISNQSKLPQNVLFLAYCFMPNHFHFLVRQEADGGISKFMGDLQNSYTKYFNAKHKRVSSLLDRQFKAVLIESQEQLFHVVRYIHLNPYSSGIVSELRKVFSYPYSFVDTNLVENFTGVKNTEYRKSVEDHAGYQRQLEVIKHLTIDEADTPGVSWLGDSSHRSEDNRP